MPGAPFSCLLKETIATNTAIGTENLTVGTWSTRISSSRRGLDDNLN